MAFFTTTAGVTTVSMAGQMAMFAVSTAMSAYGQYQQSQAAQSQARYNAAVAQNNAIIARQNAADIREAGKTEEKEHRARIGQTKGAARAVQAGQGFLVDDSEDSTNVQMMADIAAAGELDVLRIRDRTRRAEHQAEVQGVNYDAQAGLLSLKASQESPMLAAGGTLLAGAAKAAKTYKGA